MKAYPNYNIEQLKNNIDIVNYISKYIELKKSGSVYRSVCPFHDETDASFTVFPDTQSWYCFGCGRGHDIIDFVKEYHHVSFNKAVDILLKYTNTDVNNIPRIPETLLVLKQYKKSKQNKNVQHAILPKDIMNKYVKADIKEWISEGINPIIIDSFDVRYDYKANNIVFPIHDVSGNIINVKARTLYKDYKLLGVPKYRYYYPLGCLDFLFGLYQNKKSIKMSKEVIIVEGAKSVMKLMSYGFDNCCSLETNCITNEQIPLILSLKKDVVLAFDKDVPKSKIIKEGKKLSMFTNVYYIYDDKNLLDDKDSPCDKGFDIWLELYNNKKRIK